MAKEFEKRGKPFNASKKCAYAFCESGDNAVPGRSFCQYCIDNVNNPPANSAPKTCPTCDGIGCPVCRPESINEETLSDDSREQLGLPPKSEIRWQCRDGSGSYPERNTKEEALNDLKDALTHAVLHDLPRTVKHLEIWNLTDLLSVWNCVHRVTLSPRPQEGKLGE